MAKKPTKTRAIDGVLHQVNPENMEPWPDLNPRRRFDPDKHTELVKSIREHGNLQPLLVTPAKDGDVEYWIAAGERRWRAAKEANANLLCVSRELTREQAIEIAGLENLHRDDLTPIEEALWMQKMLDEVKDEDGESLTQGALAEKLGRAQSTIANALRLLKLPDNIRELVEEGLIGASHARDYLVPFTDVRIDRVRKSLFDAIAERARKTADREGGYVPGGQLHRIASDVALEHSHPLRKIGWDGKDPLFDPEEHEDCTCGGPSFQYDRYGGREKEVRCFDEQWWNKAQKEAKKREDRRRAAAEKRIRAQAEKLEGQEVLDQKDVEEIYPSHRDKVVIATRRPGEKARFDRSVLIDPSRLPEDSLLVATARFGDGLDLVCTKVGSVNASKGQTTKAVNELVEELREKARMADLKKAKKKKLEPWMLRLLVNEAGESHHGSAPPVARTAIDLGFIEDPDYRWPKLENADLDPDQVETLIKVFAIRHKRGHFSGWKDPFEEEAQEILRKKWEPALQELLPEPPADNGKKPAKKKARKKAGAAS